MLADNIIFLKKNHPRLYDEMKKVEGYNEQSSIKIENTKKNNKTLTIEKDGQVTYLHSKYDPIREAESIISKLGESEDIDIDTHIIFYGLGLGYHLDVFTQLYPNTSFSIYEPSMEIFYHYLCNKNMNNLSTRKIDNIECEYKPEVIDVFLEKIFKLTDKKIIIMDLPIYKNVFEKQYINFLDTFKKLIKNKRGSFHINYAFQKRWIVNSLMNFKEVLNTPNILMQDENPFEGKTAILVSAGPSLNDEIEYLRYIKEKGLAYIFSVGTAINALIHNDILPDAICTYDPTEKNQKVFQKINDKKIVHVPMIFGSSIGFEVLQQYKGPKLHMITSQDTISSHFLKSTNEKELKTVQDAPSVAVVALEMLYKLNFSTVILVGQNLAFSNNKSNADGVESNTKISENQKDLIKVKNVIGDEIYTNESFNRMRIQMELYIKLFDNINIINTTKNGACIEGTKFICMKKVVEEHLQQKIVSGDEFNYLVKSNSYDMQYIQSKIKEMDEEYASYKSTILELKQIIKKVSSLANNQNIKQIESMYLKLDDVFHKLESNNFYKVIVMPINRVQHSILSTNVKKAKYNKNPIEKAEKIIKIYQIFLNQLFVSTNDIGIWYNKFKENVD